MKNYTPQPGDVCTWKYLGVKRTVMIISVRNSEGYYQAVDEQDLEYFGIPWNCLPKDLKLIHRPRIKQPDINKILLKHAPRMLQALKGLYHPMAQEIEAEMNQSDNA